MRSPMLLEEYLLTMRQPEKDLFLVWRFKFLGLEEIFEGGYFTKRPMEYPRFVEYLNFWKKSPYALSLYEGQKVLWEVHKASI